MDKINPLVAAQVATMHAKAAEALAKLEAKQRTAPIGRGNWNGVNLSKRVTEARSQAESWAALVGFTERFGEAVKYFEETVEDVTPALEDLRSALAEGTEGTDTEAGEPFVALVSQPTGAVRCLRDQCAPPALTSHLWTLRTAADLEDGAICNMCQQDVLA